MNTISFIFRDAKAKLSRLGMCLFYCYMLLALTGVFGMMFGFTVIFEKGFMANAMLATSWWEAILLIVVSWLTIKIFLQEGLNLVRPNNEKKLAVVEDFEAQPTMPLSHESNVIPFKKKSTW